MIAVERILVLKLDFIGDLVTVLPAIRLLRERFPGAALTLACHPVTRVLAEATGCFDTIVAFDAFSDRTEPQESRLRRFQQAVPGAFDLAVDFRVDSDTRPLLQAVEARVRAGIGSAQDFPYLDIALPSIRASSNFVEQPRSLPRLVWHHVWSVIRVVVNPVIRVLRHVGRHTVAPRDLVYDRGKRRLVAVPKDPLPQPDLWIGEFIVLLTHLCAFRLAEPDSLERNAFPTLAEAPPPPRPILCVAPFANTDTRSWPPAAYRALVAMIVERTELDVVMLGAGHQAAAIDAIVAGMPDRVRNMAGRQDLTAVVATLRAGTLLVGNNSGLAHLGATLGTRVLALYSASHAVAEWGPRGPHVVTMTAQVPCRLCSLERLSLCEHGHRCMTMLTPDLVFAQIEALLADHPAPPVPPDLRLTDGVTLGRLPA